MLEIFWVTNSSSYSPVVPGICDPKISSTTPLQQQFQGFDQKNQFLALGMTFKFYTSLANGLNLKVMKLWGLIPMFVKVTGAFCVPPSPILNRVKASPYPIKYNLFSYFLLTKIRVNKLNKFSIFVY